MTINEYQQLALRTANVKDKENMIINGALGLSGESGEVADIIKKWKFQGHQLDVPKVVNELGDVCWYISLIATAIGADLETVMSLNIDKLKARYPDGFDANKSINRED